MRSQRRAFASVLLTLTALMGGPGLAASEAWAHSHRLQPGHGHRVHVESQSSFDHDDVCHAWLVTAQTRPSTTRDRAVAPPSPVFRVAEPDNAWVPTTLTTPLPPSRAPPSSV